MLKRGDNNLSIKNWIVIVPVLFLLLPGCVPSPVSLASVAINLLNSAPPSVAPPGPFSGRQSSVQNQRQSDPAIRDAIAEADKNTITEECSGKLPPDKLAAEGQCSARSVCLPGSKTPMQLFVCEQPSTKADPRPQLSHSTSWNWNTSTSDDTDSWEPNNR